MHTRSRRRRRKQRKPNLAPTLVGENTKAQVEELLPPQHNAATVSKKALDGKSSSKGKDEEQKSTAHPQAPGRTPGASKKRGDEAMTEKA
jgi:hypothetical protein